MYQVTLPCKPGATVFYVETLFDRSVVECRVDEFCVTQDGIYAILDLIKNGIVLRRNRGVNISDFGRTVFLTLEQAKEEPRKIRRFAMRIFGIEMPYLDLYMKEHIKPFKSRNVRHRQTCPCCGEKLVNVYLNIYYSEPRDRYLCKKCLEKALAERRMRGNEI